MRKPIQRWFTRTFTNMLWYRVRKLRPAKPCKVILFHEERGTATSYNYNGKNWPDDEGFVWTHAPNIFGIMEDEQGVKL